MINYYRLMMRLYIILMPRSLCVCVRLSVTFTFIFIINYYYLFSRAKLIIKILLPTKLSYKQLNRKVELFIGVFLFHKHEKHNVKAELMVSGGSLHGPPSSCKWLPHLR